MEVASYSSSSSLVQFRATINPKPQTIFKKITRISPRHGYICNAIIAGSNSYEGSFRTQNRITMNLQNHSATIPPQYKEKENYKENDKEFEEENKGCKEEGFKGSLYVEEDEGNLKLMLEEDEEGVIDRSAKYPGSVHGARAMSVDKFIRDGKSNKGNEWEEKMLKEALSLRRLRATQILKEEFRANQLRDKYCDNLISYLKDFIDYIIIEAASAKEIPELSTSSFTQRAKYCIDRSRIILAVKWLKHLHVSYPCIGMLVSYAAADLEGMRMRVRWLKSVNVRGRDVGKLLLKQRVILDRSIDELDTLVQFLEENGILIDWIGFILTKCPEILSLTMEELRCRIDLFLNLGMGQKDFATMVYQYPRALGFFSFVELSKKVNYIKEFGLEDQGVARLLSIRPELLACDIENKWKPFVKYLFYLGIQRSGMRRILIRKPSVFLLNLTENVAPKVCFLREIGVHDQAIGEVLVKFPPFLTYSLEKKIRPVVKFLIEIAGVSESDIGKVIALEPSLMGCSIKHKLEEVTKYFLAIGVSPQMLGKMIVDFPMLLKYNLSIIRPKFRYLKRVMVRPIEDVIEFPRFFSYSLTNRIKPRHELLVENSLHFNLQWMLASSDEVFAQRVHDALGASSNFNISNHSISVESYNSQISNESQIS